MKKIVLGILVLLGAVALYGLMYLSVFGYRHTSFYRDCERIEVGMAQGDVESVMQEYLIDDNFSIGREMVSWGGGLYIEEPSGSQCNIAIEDGRVTKIEARFEGFE